MRKKVLLVEDERHITRLVEVNLQRQGYRVETVASAAEAVASVDHERPDLIVLDVMLPVREGFDLLARLKADPATRNIPVMMLTPKARDADVFRGWRAGWPVPGVEWFDDETDEDDEETRH